MIKSAEQLIVFFVKKEVNESNFDIGSGYDRVTKIIKQTQFGSGNF